MTNQSEPNTANVIPLRTGPSRTAAGLVEVAPNLDVIEALELQDDVDRKVPFRDDIWDLDGHPSWRGKAGKQTKINFVDVPVYWKPLVKRWALLALNPELVGDYLGLDGAEVREVFGNRAAKPTTVQANVKGARLVLARLAAADLYSIDRDDWGRATAAIRTPKSRVGSATGTITTRTAVQWANQLVAIHRVGPILGWAEPFGSAPWNNNPVKVVFNETGTERQGLNRVRPTEAVGEVLGVAAFVIDELADDILNHVSWWFATNRASGEVADTEEARDALCDLYLKLLSDNDGKVPGVEDRGTTGVAHQPMCFLIGGVDHLAHELPSGRMADKATPLSKFGLKRAVDTMNRAGLLNGEAIPTVGVTPCPLSVKTFLSAKNPGVDMPWSTNLLWHSHDLKWWVSALLYSVAFYLQATLGLRDQDRDLLAPGCVRTKTVHRDGEDVVVYELHGWKQKQMRAPIRTTWAIGERIARAIGYVERLHTELGIDPTPIAALSDGSKALFDFELNVGSNRKGRDQIHLDVSYMLWFRGIANRLQSAGVVDRNLDKVPDVTA